LDSNAYHYLKYADFNDILFLKESTDKSGDGMEPYRFQQGTIPLLVSMPHTGTKLPDTLLERMSDRALTLPDTDWHLESLYSFVPELGASTLAAHYSRYVIDLNRPPDDSSLYPGSATTELCPTTLFDGSPLYLPGQEPDAKDINQRIQHYWQPYHDQLQSELQRLRDTYGVAVLWDAHSIRSQIPRLFEGRLPDLSFGTFSGQSADSQLTADLLAIAQHYSSYTAVLNGRFKGGYITRHYGNPSDRIHAIQLELVQDTYMQEEWPFQYVNEKANTVRKVLRHLLDTVVKWIETFEN
jgi:N-formylglutamate deformylase